jgi:hypothetical protein
MTMTAPGKVLAIDAGASIGYAWFVNGRYSSSGTKTADILAQLAVEWVEAEPDAVVIEPCLPRGGGALELKLRTVMGVLEAVFPDAVVIPASTWKPVAGTWPLPTLPDGGAFRDRPTQHSKDACRLAMYYLWRDHVPALKQGRCICEGEFIWACGPECECFHHAPWEEL